MSIDKTGVKYRVSNVLAWGGLLCGVLSIFTLASITESPNYRIDDLLEQSFLALGVYLGCALINYIMVGSLRLLPWKDIE
jgi:hypothetical protein